MSITTPIAPTTDSWLKWFHLRDSFDIINTSHLKKLFEAFNHSLSQQECISALSEHPESTFLHKANFGTGRVVIFHHLTFVSGTFYDSDDEKVFGFIHGVDKSILTARTPDISILCKSPTGAAIMTPTVTHTGYR